VTMRGRLYRWFRDGRQGALLNQRGMPAMSVAPAATHG
jgi:hypothetical protein